MLSHVLWAVCRVSSAMQKALRGTDGSCLTLDWNMVKSMQPIPAQRMQVQLRMRAPSLQAQLGNNCPLAEIAAMRSPSSLDMQPPAVLKCRCLFIGQS